MLTDDILWDYADGFLKGDEKLRVDAYLRQHPEQQARLESILKEKRSYAELPLEKPKEGFSVQVMAAWAAEQASAKSLATAKPKGRDWVLWGIVSAFGLMLTLPILLFSSAAPTNLLLEIPVEYLPQMQFPTFDWASFFSSALLRNAVLLTMAFMSLKLLDKYLLVRNLHLTSN